jgi:hypothetical protein
VFWDDKKSYLIKISRVFLHVRSTCFLNYNYKVRRNFIRNEFVFPTNLNIYIYIYISRVSLHVRNISSFELQQ